jgi:hypothetical protein
MELERALHLLGDQQELEHKISSIEPEHAETVASPMDRFLVMITMFLNEFMRIYTRCL